MEAICLRLCTFKFLRRCFKADVAAVYREYLKRVNNDIKTDPKKLWSFLNSKNNSSSIPDYDNKTDFMAVYRCGNKFDFKVLAAGSL
jgi:hypothetical protein